MEEITFETFEDREHMRYVMRGRLGDRCVEERIGIGLLATLREDGIIDLFSMTRDQIRRQLLEDRRMQCAFEIVITDGSEQVVMRAKKIWDGWTWYSNQVEEPFPGPITPAMIENMKCILRRKLEEREAQNQQHDVNWTHDYGQFSIPATYGRSLQPVNGSFYSSGWGRASARPLSDVARTVLEDVQEEGS